MKLFWASVGLFLVLLSGMMFFGCSSDEQSIVGSNNENATVIQSFTPDDGSTNVPVTTSIAIAFSGPVDTLSVMSNLHLAGGQQMHEWIDSLEHYGGFGMMNMGMEDHMMNWMDSIHTAGEFHWNGSRDSCEFVPDSTLMPTTEYLCLLYEGGMQDGHGGMMGGANHGDSGYHMFYFITGP